MGEELFFLVVFSFLLLWRRWIYPTARCAASTESKKDRSARVLDATLTLSVGMGIQVFIAIARQITNQRLWDEFLRQVFRRFSHETEMFSWTLEDADFANLDEVRFFEATEALAFSKQANSYRNEWFGFSHHDPAVLRQRLLEHETASAAASATQPSASRTTSFATKCEMSWLRREIDALYKLPRRLLLYVQASQQWLGRIPAAWLYRNEAWDPNQPWHSAHGRIGCREVDWRAFANPCTGRGNNCIPACSFEVSTEQYLNLPRFARLFKFFGGRHCRHGPMMSVIHTVHELMRKYFPSHGVELVWDCDSDAPNLAPACDSQQAIEFYKAARKRVLDRFVPQLVLLATAMHENNISSGGLRIMLLQEVAAFLGFTKDGAYKISHLTLLDTKNTSFCANCDCMIAPDGQCHGCASGGTLPEAS